MKAPAAKESIASKTRTIASGKTQRTYWNRIKCKERFGNPPEAFIGQATINLDSQIWKYLEYSLPKLYCADLAEAYVMQENMSLRLMCKKKKGMICNRPVDVRTRNLRQRAKMGNKLVLSLLPGSHKRLALRKQRDLCQKHGGARSTQYLGVPKVRENGKRHLIPAGKGYSVLLANCPAICSVIFVTSCHFCMGQNVLAI